MSTSGKLIFLHGDQSQEERIQGLILAGVFLVGVWQVMAREVC